MKRYHHSLGVRTLTAAVLIFLTSGCGTTTGTGRTGNITVQSSPLTGAKAAFLERGFLRGLPPFLRVLLLESSAFAGVSSFKTFKACNDTFQFIDSNGNTISIGGSSTPSVGRGLLTFSPTSTDEMTIGSLDIPSGTVINEVDITFAVVPSNCQNVGYAVEFDPGTGVIDVTQNTAFKFTYSGTPLTVNGNAQTISLAFGQIVNGMVSLGSSLSNSTIQTVNAGQAK